MELSNLRPAKGSTANKFRRGRGHASGNGKTAGYGHKGQKARSGRPRIGFEGGQMPLYRRLPKRGFKNYNRKDINAVEICSEYGGGGHADRAGFELEGDPAAVLSTAEEAAARYLSAQHTVI